MFLFRRITSWDSSHVLLWQWISPLATRWAHSLRDVPGKPEVEQYLVDNFQVSENPACILSKLVTISDIEHRVKYFKSIGLTQASIAIVFRKFPRHIMSSETEEMDKRVKFFSHYTTQFERDPDVLITHLIPQYPRLLFNPLEAMEKRLKLLEKCNITEVEIAKMLRYNPMIVLTKLENTFDDFVEYLKSWDLPDEIIHKYFTNQPRTVTYRWEAIEQRVRFFMDELGYTRERIIEVFTSNAMVFTTNVERMRERSRFIKDEMGLTNVVLIKSPLVLRYSLDRIRWRYAYLCHVGYEVTDESDLLDILYENDRKFAKYIAKQPLAQLLEFKEEFYERIGNPNVNNSPTTVMKDENVD